MVGTGPNAEDGIGPGAQPPNRSYYDDDAAYAKAAYDWWFGDRREAAEEHIPWPHPRIVPDGFTEEIMQTYAGDGWENYPAADPDAEDGSHLPYNPATDRHETGGDEIEFADEAEYE